MDDGYIVNMQLHIYAEEVNDWMKVNVLFKKEIFPLRIHHPKR